MDERWKIMITRHPSPVSGDMSTFYEPSMQVDFKVWDRAVSASAAEACVFLSGTIHWHGGMSLRLGAQWGETVQLPSRADVEEFGRLIPSLYNAAQALLPDVVKRVEVYREDSDKE